MTTEEIEAAKKRLAAYLKRLRFVPCVGGVVIDERDRPVHAGRGKRK